MRPCSTSGITRRISPAVARQPTSSSSSRTSRCMAISTPVGRDPDGRAATTATEDAQRAAGPPRERRRTPGPRRRRGRRSARARARPGRRTIESTASKPIAAALASRSGLRSTMMTRAAPRSARRVAGEQADRAGTGDRHRVAGPHAATVGDVEGDRGRVDDRALVEAQARRAAGRCVFTPWTT